MGSERKLIKSRARLNLVSIPLTTLTSKLKDTKGEYWKRGGFLLHLKHTLEIKKIQAIIGVCVVSVPMNGERAMTTGFSKGAEDSGGCLADNLLPHRTHKRLNNNTNSTELIKKVYHLHFS